MNAYELFEAMDGIDDEILERSELQRKNPLRFLRPGLIAACCVLVLSVLYAQLRYGILHPTPRVEATVDTPYYNDARYDYPEFDKTSYYALYGVDHEQINAILPQPCPQWMEFEGEAVAAADGNVRTVMLGTLTPVENTELALFLGECDPGVRIKGGAIAYKCGQAEFVMSQTEVNDGELYWVLTASADINSTPVHLEMYVSGENLDPAKKVFEETLQWLGGCPEDALDLQELVIYSEPLSWYLPYSREQFELESGYGSLLPEQDLQVYSDMELEWKNQGSGVSEEIAAVCYQGKKLVLEWTVCFDFLMPGLYNERLSDRSVSVDAQELTLHAVEQFVNKNTTLLGKSIYHAVQYENFTIYVCPWDVSAQWLYDQLVRIRDMQRDYSIYLPTEQYSETSRMTTQIIYHGGLLNETCVQVIENNKYILTWTAMDEELLTGTDTPIQARQLSQDTVSGYLSGEGTGTLLVSYDDVVVRIESNGADVQWLYDQLIAVRERVRQSEIDYKMYLPPEDSELWTEASVQKQWIYGTFLNLSMQCFRDGQLVLDWSVGDSRLAEGVGPLIEAQELTVEMLEESVEPDGKICVDVLLDGLWVSIDAYDISAQWLYDQLVAVRERVDAQEHRIDLSLVNLDDGLVIFDYSLQKPDLDGLCLKIYYMDPTAFTYAPLSAEDLKSGSAAQTISVDTQTLSEYTELLRRLNASAVNQAEELRYVNARMCYVFETGGGETVLEIVFNHPSGGIFVNGMAVEYDPVFYEVIEPFMTEDFREVWQVGS